jgi:hypothetical protein
MLIYFTLALMAYTTLLYGAYRRQCKAIDALTQQRNEAIDQGKRAFAVGEVKGRGTTVQAAWLEGWDACASALRMRHNARIADKEIATAQQIQC